jgi:hypothetical protein
MYNHCLPKTSHMADSSTFPQFMNSKRFLLFIGILHVITTLLLAVIGGTSIARPLHNEEGTWFFAQDSRVYIDNSKRLATTLEKGGLTAWLRESAPLNDKVFGLVYKLTGSSLATALLINTPLYLMLLALIFFLGRELFGRVAGSYAMIGVALVFSYFVHSTQILRSTVAVPGHLMFVLGLLTIFRKNISNSKLIFGVLTAFIGHLIIYNLRSQMLIINLVFTGFVAIVTTCLWLFNRRAWRHQALGILVLMGLLAMTNLIFNVRARTFSVAPSNTGSGSVSLIDEVVVMPPTRSQAAQTVWQAERPKTPLKEEASTEENSPKIVHYIKSYFGYLINAREGFRQGYPHSTSNIDTDRELRTAKEFLSYIPRALQIGLAAPFPSMWMKRGRETGHVGRLIAGIEMIYIYGALLLVGRCLWIERNDLRVWMLFGYALWGLLIHALAITNIGCLYRQRYFFWFLFIVLASQGLNSLKSDRKSTDIADPQFLRS